KQNVCRFVAAVAILQVGGGEVDSCDEPVVKSARRSRRGVEWRGVSNIVSPGLSIALPPPIQCAAGNGVGTTIRDEANNVAGATIAGAVNRHWQITHWINHWIRKSCSGALRRSQCRTGYVGQIELQIARAIVTKRSDIGFN